MITQQMKPPAKHMIRLAAKEMLAELEGGWLEVCKVPNGHGGYIRVAVSVNAEWYRIFCRDHKGWRKRGKDRTYIKRCHTIRALRELKSGKTKTIYANRLLPYVADYIERESA